MNANDRDPEKTSYAPELSSRPKPAGRGPAVEVAHLGAKAVLHSSASGAVVLSDAFGLRVLHALKTGTEAKLARAISRGGSTVAESLALIEAVTSAWQEAGLLAETRPGLEAATTRRRVHRDAAILDLRHGAQCVRLRSEAPDVALRAARTFEDYLVDPGGDVTRTLDLFEESSGFTLLSDGRPFWHAAEEDPARFVLFQEILSHLAGDADVGAIVHGALVTRGKRALMLAGTTGRGKTTLSLALTRTGWSYASDDLFVIGRTGAEAIALPLRAHVKPERPGNGPSAQEYLRPRSCIAAGSRLGIDSIVFPHYRAGHAASILEIAPVEALKELLTSGTHASRQHRSIVPLVTLAGRVRSFQLAYGTTAEAVCLCDALLDG